MSWENILKTEYVWLLYEDLSGMEEELVGIFKSEEAAKEYIVKEHTMSKPLTDENLEDIYASYGYIIDKKELHG